MKSVVRDAVGLRRNRTGPISVNDPDYEEYVDDEAADRVKRRRARFGDETERNRTRSRLR